MPKNPAYLKNKNTDYVFIALLFFNRRKKVFEMEAESQRLEK